MKTVYSPKRPGAAADWSGNTMSERKVKIKNQKTIDEFGNRVVKPLIVRR